MRDRHNPPPYTLTQRTSAAPQHTASPCQVITNEWTSYMAATINPETADGLGGPLGWWRYTENLYRLVQAYRPKFLRSPMSTSFLRDWPWKFAYIRVECAPAEPFTNWCVFICVFMFGQIFGFCIFLDIWVLRDPTFPVQKKKSWRARQGHIQGLSLKKSVKNYTFVR